MARITKKNKNLQDAKTAASDPGDVGTDPPKLCLTILLPKKAKKPVTSPELRGANQPWKQGANQYLCSCGSLEAADDDDASETELLMPASDPGDVGTDPPKLCLTILLPKKAKKPVTSPELRGANQPWKQGANQYLCSCGSLEAADDDDASETELLMREKIRAFENGVENFDQDSGDGSMSADAEEEEDELESDKDNEEKAPDESNSESGSPMPEASLEPVPEAKQKRKKVKKQSSLPDVLKISIPINNTNLMSTVPCTISFQELLTKVANIMSLALNQVRIVYRFSTQPCGDTFNHLPLDNKWKELLATAVQPQKLLRSQKTFIVELKDLAVKRVRRKRNE
ncbi:hypothetical protein DFH08DRAFT_1024675 [Mycena albidolilacea]|uniref:Uncharacterized protein n=1 Tax=Mycena albidolilacea TaxID=1033008 RepID=A0AAD7ALX7_9AGAR|nr:hypothetical protein DFH08DRAFT_1024675 [Mycena albidolilacea]